MTDDAPNCGPGNDYEIDTDAAAETEVEILLIRQCEQRVLLLAAMSGSAGAERRAAIAETWHKRRRKWRDRRRRHSPWFCLICEAQIDRDHLSSDFIAAVSARDDTPNLWFFPLCKCCEPNADPDVDVLKLAEWMLQATFPNARLLPSRALSPL
jgi:hypothetical protein